MADEEFESIWMEAVFALLKYYPGTSLEGQCKTTKYFSQYNQSPSRDLKQAPPRFRTASSFMGQQVAWCKFV
jgi:hypothetical protein